MRSKEFIIEAEQRLGVEVIGLQGEEPHQRPFRKLFKTQEEFKAWKTANDEHGDVVVKSTRVIDSTQSKPEPELGPDNRESFQLFHGKGSDKGQPLNMTKDKAIRFVKNQVMQQKLIHWAALVNSDGKVVWTWDPNGFMPDRFTSGRDTKPLPAQYAQYDELPGTHTMSVHNLVDTNEGMNYSKNPKPTTGQRQFKEPRKDDGRPMSRSEKVGKDGLIYHWQDPRAN
jgi:hypothetical protein